MDCQQTIITHLQLFTIQYKRQQYEYSYICYTVWCVFRGSSQWVVLLCSAGTLVQHSLHIICHLLCSLECFHTMDDDLLWGTSSSFQLCQTSEFSFNGLLCVVKQSFNIVLLSIQKAFVSRGTAVTGICRHIIRQWSGGALHSIDGAISVDRLDLIVES